MVGLLAPEILEEHRHRGREAIGSALVSEESRSKLNLNCENYPNTLNYKTEADKINFAFYSLHTFVCSSSLSSSESFINNFFSNVISSLSCTINLY